MKNYHFEAELLDVSVPEYFASEVVSAHRVGPCTRLVFAAAKVGANNGRPHRETIVSVVMPTEMVAMLAEHIRTGVPARAQQYLTCDPDGELVGKAH